MVREKLVNDVNKFLLSGKGNEITMLRDIEHRLYLLSEMRNDYEN